MPAQAHLYSAKGRAFRVPQPWAQLFSNRQPTLKFCLVSPWTTTVVEVIVPYVNHGNTQKIIMHTHTHTHGILSCARYTVILSMCTCHSWLTSCWSQNVSLDWLISARGLAFLYTEPCENVHVPGICIYPTYIHTCVHTISIVIYTYSTCTVYSTKPM